MLLHSAQVRSDVIEVAEKMVNEAKVKLLGVGFYVVKVEP
jgi:hypothetical protein